MLTSDNFISSYHYLSLLKPSKPATFFPKPTTSYAKPATSCRQPAAFLLSTRRVQPLYPPPFSPLPAGYATVTRSDKQKYQLSLSNQLKNRYNISNSDK